MLRNANRPLRSSGRLSALALLAGTFFAAGANAAGFGELILHSRIGENLLAEVPLLGSAKELADPACYTLAPNPGSDLPVVTNARIRVARDKDGYRLLIVGSRPVAEPAFSISLRANCGIDLRHDYVLMPDAPLPVAEMIESAAPTLGQRRSSQETETDRPAPSKRKQRATASRHGNSPSRQDSGRSGPGMSQTAAPAGDRLLLSTSPLELKPGESAAPDKAKELEDRLLKMETSLRTLNQEIETLGTSLQLSTEMLSARHDLQQAQSAQPTVTATRANPPAAPQRRPSSGDWLELFAGTLLGGSLAVATAGYLGRHRQSKRPII